MTKKEKIPYPNRKYHITKWGEDLPLWLAGKTLGISAEAMGRRLYYKAKKEGRTSFDIDEFEYKP